MYPAVQREGKAQIKMMKFYLCLIDVSSEMIIIMQRRFTCPPCFYHQKAPKWFWTSLFLTRLWQRAGGPWLLRSNHDISITGKSISAMWGAGKPMGITEKEKGSLKQATFPRNSWYYYYFRKQNLLKGIGILPDLGLKKKGEKNNKRKKKFRAFED